MPTSGALRTCGTRSRRSWTGAIEDFVRANQRAVRDPVEGIVAGCAAFIGEAQRNPPWGALIAHSFLDFHKILFAVRERLNQDLRRAQNQHRLASHAEEVGFDLVVGVVIQAMRSATEARLAPGDVPDIVQGILRALGASLEEAESVERRALEAVAATQEADCARRKMRETVLRGGRETVSLNRRTERHS